MRKYETIDFEISNGLAIIKFNRPDRLNALNSKLKAEFLDALRFLNMPSSEGRALLITGNGRGFCAGADLSEGPPENHDLGADLVDTYHPFLLELANLKIPVISAVNGVAAGAGMSIAIAADIILAAKSAYFLQAFVNIGLTPDAGSTFLLPRLVGLNRARAMMMLGEKLEADQAMEWGLVYEVIPDEKLAERAVEISTRLANGPTVALGGIRSLLAQSLTADLQSQLGAEANMQRIAGHSKDSAEGIMAFIQKRSADFKGS